MFKHILAIAAVGAYACGPASAGALAKGALARVGLVSSSSALARPEALPYWINYDLTLYPKMLKVYTSNDFSILSTAVKQSVQAASGIPIPPALPGLASYGAAVVDPLTAGGIALVSQPPPPLPRFPGQNAPTVVGRAYPGVSH